MKPIVLIASCARDRSGQESQSKLLRGVMDYRFVLGVGNCSNRDDELILPVRDDYLALPVKMRAAFRWAIEHEYTHVFKCDRDTFIHADRLLKSAREHFEPSWPSGYLDAPHDFVGLVGNPGDCCGGGAGYWLSKRAIIAYLESYDERQIALAPRQQLEDWCLFWSLDHATPRISPVCDRRYWDLRLGPVPDQETNITWNPWKP